METPMSRYLAKLIHYSKYLTPDGSRKFAGPESEASAWLERTQCAHSTIYPPTHLPCPDHIVGVRKSKAAG
jgi:hypothetical protein